MGQENAEGLEGDPDSVTWLAQQRGFDKCPVCWTLVVKDAILTECAHKFCEPCLATLAAHSFSFSCPSCRTLCLAVKTIAADKVYRQTKQFTCPAAECDAAALMTLEEFDEHIRRQCPSRLIKCDCGTLIKSSLYAHHRQTAHPTIRCTVCGEESRENLPHLCLNERVACGNCRCSVQRRRLAEHLAKCPLRLTQCKSCGLPGPRNVISPHENKCTLELCPYCTRLFRADKLRRHSCPSKPVACPLSECSFEGHYGSLGRHMATHPQLVDTGVFSEIDPTIYVVSDEKNPAEARFARKITEYSDRITVTYFGLRATEFIGKDSPRLSLLTEVLPARYSFNSLHRLFADLSLHNIQSLFTQGCLTHKEGEIISQLEIQYKYQLENFPTFGALDFSSPSPPSC